MEEQLHLGIQVQNRMLLSCVMSSKNGKERKGVEDGKERDLFSRGLLLGSRGILP